MEASAKTIPLSKGFVAVIDSADWDVVKNYSWHVLDSGPSGKPYARSSATLGRRKILMHTLLTGFSETDHINGDGLDNRRANLRKATRSQNMGNQRLRISNKSGYKGVSWDTYACKWRADIGHGVSRRYLGLFADPIAAARAYDVAAQGWYGEYAMTNAIMGLVP